MMVFECLCEVALCMSAYHQLIFLDHHSMPEIIGVQTQEVILLGILNLTYARRWPSHLEAASRALVPPISPYYEPFSAPLPAWKMIGHLARRSHNHLWIDVTYADLCLEASMLCFFRWPVDVGAIQYHECRGLEFERRRAGFYNIIIGNYPRFPVAER